MKVSRYTFNEDCGVDAVLIFLHLEKIIRIGRRTGDAKKTERRLHFRIIQSLFIGMKGEHVAQRLPG